MIVFKQTLSHRCAWKYSYCSLKRGDFPEEKGVLGLSFYVTVE